MQRTVFNHYGLAGLCEKLKLKAFALVACMTRVVLEQSCFIDYPLYNLTTKSPAVKFGLESKNLNGFTEVK